jgi:hypothetical protein
MAKNPIWRTTVAALSGTVDSKFQRLLDSEAVVVAVGLAHTVQRDMAKRTERASSRLWHVLNLPTSSDVNRLFAQLGSVEREIRVLEKRLGDSVVDDSPNGTSARPVREVIPGAKPHRSAGGARPRPS